MENNKYPEYKSLSEWDRLSDEDLRSEIKKNILGFGMDGSARFYGFISECYEKIENIELRNRVNKILIELVEDITSSVGGRAIYICSTLRLRGMKEKIIEIIQKSDEIFTHIKKATEGKDWSSYISYLHELNNAIGLLNIVEAKDFLIKQLHPLKKPAPHPITKEYYLYYESAQSALEVLKRIDPELANKYERKNKI